MKRPELTGEGGSGHAFPTRPAPRGLQSLRVDVARNRGFPFRAPSSLPVLGSLSPPFLPPLPVCVCFHWSRLPTCSRGSAGGTRDRGGLTAAPPVSRPVISRPAGPCREGGR